MWTWLRVLALVAGGVGCGRYGFGGAAPAADGDDRDAPMRDTAGAIDALADAGPDAPGAYHATAMHFASADDDYLHAGPLTNAVSSTSGVSSMWLRVTGDDGTAMQLLNAKIAITGGTQRNANDHIQVFFANCNTTTTLQFESSIAVTKASGWVHVLSSWDTGTNKFDFYIDDVRDPAVATLTNMTNCYQAVQWGIGGMDAGTLDADLADFYLATGTYLDLSQASNRRLFSDAQHHPVDLGPSCANPTGAQPILCFHGDAATWPTNKGFGGGFDVMGNGLTEVAGP